ncbi:hypothetical protein N8209_05460 [Gammaproteobacteria bacterium]|nr:hypothetical protein [Gammaproteobacteria bacterium]
MEIKKLALLLMTIFIVTSCVENKSVENKKNTVKTEKTYYEFGYAYLMGEDINLWSKIPDVLTSIDQESSEEANEPLLVIDAVEPLEIMVLGLTSEKLVIQINGGKEWLKIRYRSEEELKEGFVDYSNIFSDKGGKVLYAIHDDADDRIKISPKNYSTSSQLNLTKQYEGEGKYGSNKISNKHCDLYDAAIIISSLDDLDKGEYETKQEFADRKDSLRRLADSTGAKEKIYAFSKSLPTKSFNYDVDTETLSIDILSFGVRHTCTRGYPYCEDKVYSNIKDISYGTANRGYEKERVLGNNCSVSGRPVFNLGKKRTSLGQFNFVYDESGYSAKFGIVEKMKLDRNSARRLKETEGLEYKYLIGLSVDGNTFKGSQWKVQRCGGKYNNENCYETDEGSFDFSSNIEYLILFDDTGNIVKSYFTSNYIDNYLKNDLLIQENAYENKSILEELDLLEEKEQLAKLFFNRIKK